jgi:hypothetical protein
LGQDLAYDSEFARIARNENNNERKRKTTIDVLEDELIVELTKAFGRWRQQSKS